jgi:hypothetical protein
MLQGHTAVSGVRTVAGVVAVQERYDGDEPDDEGEDSPGNPERVGVPPWCVGFAITAVSAVSARILIVKAWQTHV